MLVWRSLHGDEKLTCFQVLQGVPAAHRLWQEARSTVDTAFPLATVTPHIFVTGNCSKVRAPYKEPGLLIDSNGHVVGCHFDDSGLVCFMLAGEKTFWNAPPQQLGLNMPSGEGGANFGTSQAHANERHDVHPQTNLRVHQWFVAHLKPGDIFFLPAWWWYEVRTGPSRSWSVNMWIHDPQAPCPQRAHEDAILNLEPDPVFVSGVTGKYSQALNGEYDSDGTLHNGRPLFRKVGGAIFLRFDQHSLWEFCTKHTVNTSHAALALGVTKNLALPHGEVKWRTFVDQDTWGVCPTMSCTRFTPATIDDANAPMTLHGMVTPAATVAEVLPSTTAQPGSCSVRQPAPEHACLGDDGVPVLAAFMREYASRSPSRSSSPTHSVVVPLIEKGVGVCCHLCSWVFVECGCLWPSVFLGVCAELASLGAQCSLSLVWVSVACLSDDGGPVLAALKRTYASRSPSRSSAPTHCEVVPEDIDTFIDPSASPSADSLVLSQVFNDTNASMPRAMHADFDLLRKLPFSACNLKNRRAQTFPAATATEGVPASHIGQYVVSLKNWQPALSQVWVSVAICVAGCVENLHVWVPSAH